MPVVPGKLGCRPPRPGQRERLLRLRNYLNSSLLPAPPASTEHRSGLTWPVHQNDRLSNCTLAAAAHLQQEWSFLAGAPRMPTEADLVSAYAIVSGCDPQTGAHDDGAVLVDVLDYWRKFGIAGDRLAAYVGLNVKNHADVIEAIYLFGGIDCGVALPAAWQGADLWDAPSRWHSYGRHAPGSWGGHCVAIVDYDPHFLYAVTWGQVVPVTYAAWDLYFQEAYALLDPLWFSGDRVAPNGFDLETLRRDLQAITGKSPLVESVMS